MTFRTIAGHRRIKNLLSAAIARESIPPTLLFAGPRGVGKTLTARATALALNCLDAVRHQENLAIDACGACRACGRILRDMHVDVVRVEPDERASIKIDVVRDVLGATAFRPFEGRRRVVIIREADALELPAQNALLKSLEEPPPATVFILTTAVPGALVPTIRSRCMRLAFERLTESEIAAVLERDHGVSAPNAQAAAALADGSVGQAIAFGSPALEGLRKTALDVLEQGARSNAVAARLQAAAAVVGPPKNERTRDEIGLILRLLTSMLRDIEVLNAGGDTRVLANRALSKELTALTRSYAGGRARAAFGAVDRALAALDRNAGAKVVAEWVVTHI